MTTLDPYEHTLADAVKAAQWSLTASHDDLQHEASAWHGRALMAATLKSWAVYEVAWRGCQWMTAMVTHRLQQDP